MKKYTNICKRKKKYLQITSQNRKSWFSLYALSVAVFSPSVKVSSMLSSPIRLLSYRQNFFLSVLTLCSSSMQLVSPMQNLTHNACS